MTVAPELAQLLANLADLTLRNTAAAVTTKIQSIIARKQQAEAINELVEIVNDLIVDRNELLGIARGLEEALVAQRVSDDEIDYIIETLIPTVEQLMQATGDPSSSEFIEPLKSVLSVETLKILQLVGFNFKAAIGEPLTQLVESLILANVPKPDAATELQVLSVRRELLYLEVAKDPEAFERLRAIGGQG